MPQNIRRAILKQLRGQQLGVMPILHSVTMARDSQSKPDENDLHSRARVWVMKTVYMPEAAL